MLCFDLAVLLVRCERAIESHNFCAMWLSLQFSLHSALFMDFDNLRRSRISQFDILIGTYWHTAGQIVDDFLTIYVPVFKM